MVMSVARCSLQRLAVLLKLETELELGGLELVTRRAEEGMMRRTRGGGGGGELSRCLGLT